MGLFNWLFYYGHLSAVGAVKMLEEQIWDRHRPLPADLPPGSGRNVVITGGNRGMGLEAVKTMLNLGYQVIIGCRNPDACEKTLSKLKEDLKVDADADYKVLKLDLTSLASVEEFADQILAMDLPIHVLLNNAGIMFVPKRQLTEDGIESHMAVNHISHLALTRRLLPKLKLAGNSNRHARIVNVSSAAHRVGSYVDFEDLNCDKYYSPHFGYANSKAAQILCTKYLNGRLAEEDAHVSVFSIHPGVVNTDLYENMRLMKLLIQFMMKSASQGSDTLVHACVAPELEGQGGAHLANSQIVQASQFCCQKDNQAKMWTASCKLAGVQGFYEQ